MPPSAGDVAQAGLAQRLDLHAIIDPAEKLKESFPPPPSQTFYGARGGSETVAFLDDHSDVSEQVALLLDVSGVSTEVSESADRSR